MNWIKEMPMLTFNCRMAYETPRGHGGSASVKVRAIAADIALIRAEEILKVDGRRRIKRIVAGMAVQA